MHIKRSLQTPLAMAPRRYFASLSLGLLLVCCSSESPSSPQEDSPSSDLQEDSPSSDLQEDSPSSDPQEDSPSSDLQEDAISGDSAEEPDSGAPRCADDAVDGDSDGVPCELDCDDTDPDVFPGQTEFFAVARPDGTFDYDCDDLETLEHDAYTTCDPPTCGFEPGWFRNYGPGIPACGEEGLWDSGYCQTESGPDMDVYCSGGEMPTDLVQSCR